MTNTNEALSAYRQSYSQSRLERQVNTLKLVGAFEVYQSIF